jgi:hypothetical protein
MKITFNEVGIQGTKRGTCPRCGKKASRSKKFFQTRNPFNTNSEGFVKTQDEILVECREELLEWKKQPVFHAKCEEEG